MAVHFRVLQAAIRRVIATIPKVKARDQVSVFCRSGLNSGRSLSTRFLLEISLWCILHNLVAHRSLFDSPPALAQLTDRAGRLKGHSPHVYK